MRSRVVQYEAMSENERFFRPQNQQSLIKESPYKMSKESANNNKFATPHLSLMESPQQHHYNFGAQQTPVKTILGMVHSQKKGPKRQLRQQTRSIGHSNEVQLPKIHLGVGLRKNQSTVQMEVYEKQRKIKEDEEQAIDLGIFPSLKPMMQHQPNIKLFPFLMKTKAGCQVNKVTKTNQDSAIANPKCLEKFGCQFYAVCDGHGQNGHLVSGFLKQNLPKNISKSLAKIRWADSEVVSALSQAFILTNKQLIRQDFDTNLSGSTTISVLIHEPTVYCANVGDSRAILCSHQNNKWSVEALNIDHKPDYEKERKRIIARGGRIAVHRDEDGQALGPERVWLAYVDAPGLAMTRSFGDQVGAQAGVIAEPETFTYELQPQNKFMVVASDGVFEYMSNEQVMNIVIPNYENNNLQQACDRLVNAASQSWFKESIVRDDITCIVIFLK